MLLLLQFCFVIRETSYVVSDNNQADVVEAFNSTSRYQDGLPDIDNPYFEQMGSQVYPAQKIPLILNPPPVLDLAMSIVSSKIYDKRDDFNFEITNFPFLAGDTPHSPSYGVYISQHL